MIIFRADGNQHIGTGHVMRCMSIAQALISSGADVKFVLADESMKELLESKGFKVCVMGTLYNDMDAELPFLSKQVHLNDILILDSYFITKQYLQEVSKMCSIAYVDDLLNIPGQVDYLINYNVYAEEGTKEVGDLVEQIPLLGVKYVPLRNEFQNVTYEVQKEGSQILITTGGADEYNIAGQLLTYFTKVDIFKNITFKIVVGSFNQHKDYLQNLSDQYDNIILYHNVKNMSTLMQSCDVAIAAAGSTLYELCAVGIPTIGLSFVPNQERIGEGMKQNGTVIFTGHYHKEGTVVLERAVSCAISLLGECDKRQQLSSHARTLVDGQGAKRIAKAIVEWHEKGK